MEGSAFTLEVSIPANTVARVHVPANSEGEVTEGASPAAGAPGVAFTGMQDGCAVFEVQSGDYRFRSASGGPRQAVTGG